MDGISVLHEIGAIPELAYVPVKLETAASNAIQVSGELPKGAFGLRLKS